MVVSRVGDVIVNDIVPYFKNYLNVLVPFNTAPYTSRMASSSAARGRPIDLDKRRQIAAAASERFVHHGFDGLSLEAVAAAAGVSKVTIYRAFGDRSGLLAAVVALESERMEQSLAAVSVARAPLAAMLETLALSLLQHLARPEVQAFEHAIGLEARRHPALLRRFFDAGPGRIRSGVAALLAEHGVADAAALADELIAAWTGALPMESRFGVAPAPDLPAIRRRLRPILARFGELTSAAPTASPTST
jgi:TetR/AcrR family transcriptional regulator, mexJK operon transcriptional repressor